MIQDVYLLLTLWNYQRTLLRLGVINTNWFNTVVLWFKEI